MSKSPTSFDITNYSVGNVITQLVYFVGFFLTRLFIVIILFRYAPADQSTSINIWRPLKYKKEHCSMVAYLKYMSISHNTCNENPFSK